MTDGNMGFQVAPTEDEMANASAILTRMINAVVGMSQLQADVDMLRTTVQSLQSDAERLRNQNAGLDEALFHARQARHELEAKAKAAEESAMIASAASKTAIRSRDYAESQLADTKSALTQALDERDEAQFRVLELEDKLKAAEGKLAKVQEVFGIVTEPPKAEPVQAEPIPAPEPAPLADPAPPTRTYFDHWSPGALWDSDKAKYYNEA